ncbi:hypothetical protein G6F57_007789 [Rhizopus arrhizus]|uniref:WRKY domain-containing protein n=1 Tax=Rhizopus oryzae TaxID=64495 RepID=A0A9P6X6Q7_RHIOR|nr:hypothetical protein G6F23_004155 [Rhizopus arrhizus]KAG1420553.1 hypothetical protein G6F58_004139 [Rhizopus delemar]KAG0764520.1 hypothetical protein G6F24_005151 [Rhizopus arrhizus]KAG0776033.1 hypothetical protein G6F22_012867 [Rhizopus arrhizus]KAG0790983.1 hypothetical protein G6F21_005414 [Rhizopus arrhizus]
MKAVDQTGDLQDIIYSYQSQPELLKLILSSKLEEDKRRAEEAKLRAKELDLLLLQQHQMSDYNNEEQNDFSTLFPTTYHIQPTPPISQSSSTDGYHQLRRTSLDAILSNSNPLLPQHNRRDSNLGSSFTTDSDDLDDKTFSPIPSNTSSTLLHMESYQPAIMSPLSKSIEEDSIIDHHRRYSNIPPKPRRRREMQAITKIVETKEYPYMDGYFWKNNGNTVQKKTGNKSVYYKCSNSNKGCPVNKTVTWKGNGEYLIKYRGEHLIECNKVQRIVDV